MLSQEDRAIKVYTREELQKILNCDRTKFNEIMHSKSRIPAVKIGAEYYSTDYQIMKYFGHKESRPVRFNVLYKVDLMELFNMGRTKFLQFIKTRTLPLKIIGNEYYISEQALEKWFLDFQGETISLG